MDINKIIKYFKINNNTELVCNINNKLFNINNIQDIIKILTNDSNLININQYIITKQQDKSNKYHTKKHIIEYENYDTIIDESYITVYSIIKPYISTENNLIDYQFNVNKIDKINKNHIISTDRIYIEIKKNISIILDNYSDWIININLLKNININEIERYKHIFILSDELNTIDNIPYNDISDINIQLSYIGDKNNLNESNIFELINYLNPIFIDNVNLNIIEYQKEIYNIAKLIITDKRMLYNFKERSGFKRLVNNVVELNRNIYYNDILPNIKHYYLTDKIDGQRCMCIINENKDKINIKILSDKLYKINKYNDIIEEEEHKLTIYDCEILYSSELNNIYELEADKVKLYIFDILIYENKNISSEPFENRYKYLEKAENKIKDLKLGKMKKFIKLTKNYKKEIKNFYENSNKSEYDIDGLIFTPTSKISEINIQNNTLQINSNYTNMIAYKWKPEHLLTIDFYIAELPKTDYNKEQYKNIKDEKIYILCSGINKKDFDKIRMNYIENYVNIIPKIYHDKQYFPIQFAPSDNPLAYIFTSKNKELHNKIGEFRYNKKEKKWELLKIRNDRNIELQRGEYYGNALKYAELIWLNIENPITLDELITSEPQKYFIQNSNNIYKAQRNFNSFVKTKLIETIIDKNLSDKNETKWIIDLAAGKGQDLARIINLGFENGLFIDIDSDALYELIERKYNIKNQKNKMSIYTKQLDLTSDYTEIINKLSNIPLPKEGVDVIICNFAIHYLIKDENKILNIINLIKTLLKENGRFIFTTFNGEKIFNILKDSNIWELTENNNIKYSIKKQYKSTGFLKFNQEIGVLLPFSKNQYYTEYLVNLEYILTKFKENGFNIEISNSFSTLLEQFKLNNNKIYNELTTNDKEYVSLYQFNILKKTNNKINNNIRNILNIENEYNINI